MESLSSLPAFGWVLLGAWLLLGLASGGGVAGAGALGLGLKTYSRLTFEQPAVHIVFPRQAPDRYQAVLRFPDGDTRQFLLQGQEWQVDARVLRWKGPAVVAGM